MKRTYKRTWVGMAGSGLIVGALAVVGWLAWPRERLLTNVAQPVLKMDIMKEKGYWLSGNQILIITTDHENSYGHPHWLGHADLFDTSTHTRTRLEGLTKLFSSPDMSPWGPPGEFEISPNGNWLHWSNWRFKNGYMDKPACAKMDGSQFRDLPLERGVPGFWLDDRHYVEVGRKPLSNGWQPSEVVVYDARNPDGDHHYTASSTQAQAILKAYYAAHPTTIVVPRDQEAGTIEVARSQDLDASMGEKRDRPLGSFPVTFPDHMRPDAYYVSPKQNAVVYRLCVTKIPPLQAWLHRYLPSVPIHPVVTEGLWVSHVDGQGLHEIGYVLAKVDSDGYPIDQLHAIQWLPDGKRISFVHGKTLYLVSVQKEE